MRDRCLIITGTVVPNVALAGHDDLAIRRQQYMRVLSFYSEVLDDAIYFLENSIYDIEGDDEFGRLLHDKRITLVKFPVSHEIERGKGFQEFQMIDEIVESLSCQYHSFIKVSGRYQYLNIKKLTDSGCAGLMIDMLRRQRVAITSMFYSTMAFYREYLAGLYLEVDDSQGQWIERRLYKRLKSRSCRQYAELFPVSPVLQIPGSSRGSDRNTARGRVKCSIRCMERRILRACAIKELYI